MKMIKLLLASVITIIGISACKPNGFPSQIYYPDPADPALIYKISFVYKT